MFAVVVGECGGGEVRDGIPRGDGGHERDSADRYGEGTRAICKAHDICASHNKVCIKRIAMPLVANLG